MEELGRGGEGWVAQRKGPKNYRQGPYTFSTEVGTSAPPLSDHNPMDLPEYPC